MRISIENAVFFIFFAFQLILGKKRPLPLTNKKITIKS